MFLATALTGQQGDSSPGRLSRPILGTATGTDGSIAAQTRIFEAVSYLFFMPQRPFEPCIPTRGKKVPAGPDWIHEIKHDGYRLIVHRDGKRVRLFTRNGHDWTDRYPLIVEAALKNRSSSFVIDGEAVLLGVDGVSDFDGLHSRQHDNEVQLYAFDCLALDGDDLRKLPLSMRKANLARLSARRPEGIFVGDFEQGEIGPDLFRKACEYCARDAGA